MDSLLHWGWFTTDESLAWWGWFGGGVYFTWMFNGHHGSGGAFGDTEISGWLSP